MNLLEEQVERTKRPGYFYSPLIQLKTMLVSTGVAYYVPEVHVLVAQSWYPRNCSCLDRIPYVLTYILQGELNPNKSSGVGTNFELLVHVLSRVEIRYIFNLSLELVKAALSWRHHGSWR
jgi:hypothetical protein